MRSEGRRRRCSYCDRRAKSYKLGELAERIHAVFEEHYRRTSDQPHSWQLSLLSDRESDYDWERDGEPVVYAIANSADLAEEAAEDIQSILEFKHDDFDSAAMGEETEYSEETYYEEIGVSDGPWQEEWQNFEQSLKTEARFFSQSATAHLESIFNGIETMSASDGRPLVVDVGPETAFQAMYRARTFQSDSDLEPALCRPDLQLGSPPARLAAAGRMNARGISVFYGANEPNVAIAEVRPPVGSQVAVARFDIIRPIRLLDLTALRELSEGGSVFDPNLGSRMGRAMFLRSLSERITQPVMPDDEDFDYLATQAIADFLATDSNPQIDGIIFPSVQSTGFALNYVLFQKAARVELIDIPKGTEIEASTGQTYEDGWETEYSVFESVPPQSPQSIGENDPMMGFGPMFSAPWPQFDPDPRPATLRIDLGSIKIHRVQGVEFSAIEFDVRRVRFKKTEPDF